MSERSVLRVRDKKHHRPGRENDTIIEVVRDGAVVATIYGSREGIHVVSERLESDDLNVPFRIAASPAVPVPALVLPLLSPGEPCPWCADGPDVVKGLPRCPVCGKPVQS